MTFPLHCRDSGVFNIHNRCDRQLTRNATMNTPTTPNIVHPLASAAQAATLEAVMAQVPATDGEADRALARSLATYGQLAPILRRGGQVVDGRRRMTALTALGREPWVVDLPVSATETTNAELLGRSFVELNGTRRELTVGVRAAIAHTLATLRKGANQHNESAGVSRAEAARAMGLSTDTLDRYRRIKDVDDVHARVLAGTLSLSQAVRTVECRALASRARDAVAPSGDIAACIDQLAVQGVAHSVLLVDAPWDYNAKAPGTHCSEPGRHYPTLSVAELKALRVDRMAAKDAVLWMWTPNCLLAEALDVLKAWGSST